MVVSNAKKAKTQKNSNRRTEAKVRPMFFKTEGQAYAIVVKLLGGPLMEVHTFDGAVYQAHTRGGRKNKRGGRSKPKYILQIGDTILISLRDFDETKADILLKYSVAEIEMLRKAGEVPSEALQDFGACGIVFGAEKEITHFEEMHESKEEIDISAL